MGAPSKAPALRGKGRASNISSICIVALKHRHPRNLSFRLGFDMDRDKGRAVHVGFQGFLDPVANLMRVGDAGVARDNKMELAN